MGLFGKLKDLFTGAAKAPEVRIECTTYAQPNPNGGYSILFERVEGERRDQVSLPLPGQREVTHARGVTSMALGLSQLLDRQELPRTAEGGYLLPYEQLSKIDESMLNLLGIRQAKGWTVHFESRGTVSERSTVKTCWTDPEGSYDVVAQSSRYLELPCGFLDTSKGQLHVFSRDLWRAKRAAEALAQQPASVEDEYEALAHLQDMVRAHDLRVKEDGLAPPVQVELSAQLKNERFYAPRKIGLTVEKTESGLDLKPQVEGIQNDQTLLQADRSRQAFFEKHADGSTSRIVLPMETLQELNYIRTSSHIPNKDIAAFIRDPRRMIHPPSEDDLVSGGELEEEESILDLSNLTTQLEALKLEDYSDRVAEISMDPAAEASSHKDRPFTLGGDLLEGSHVDEALIEDLADDRSEGEDAFEVKGHASLKTFDNLDELEYEVERAKLLRATFAQLSVPESFLAKFYPYQEEGYAWLRTLHDHSEASIGGLLADDMGLGKTIQLIALICHMHEHRELGPSLFVVPKVVIPNWQRELEKFCSSRLIVEEHIGNDRTRRVARLERADIILTTYDTLVRDQLMLGRIDFHMLLLDEAQYIKNYTTKRASAARAMKARLRMALTATPVENNLQELWAIMDFAQPSLLGTMREFRHNIAKPLEAAAARNDDSYDQETVAVLETMGGHYLRRTKLGVLVDMPPKTIHTINLPMTDAQMRIYRRVKDYYRTHTGVLPAIRPMLNVCTHPYGIREELLATLGEESDLSAVLDDPALLIESSNKFAWLVTKLKEIQEVGEKVIIFSSLRRIQELLHALVYTSFELHASVINGDVSAGSRQQIIDRFTQSRGFNVIILSAQAAGVGVNVTGANHVVHMTREWNPAKENQATDRAYRIGQKRPVHVYLPITSCVHFDTLDERIDMLLTAKQRLATNVIRPSQDLQIKLNELESCLQHVGDAP